MNYFIYLLQKLEFSMTQNQYQLNIELVDFLEDQLNCEQYISDNFDIFGFVKCEVASKAIKIFFNPAVELNEELIFQEINSILQQIGIAFVRMTIKQYSFSLGRTLASAATGGAVGARAGPVGAIIGGLIATYIEQKLFGWKDTCCCECDEFGNYNITHYYNTANGGL